MIPVSPAESFLGESVVFWLDIKKQLAKLDQPTHNLYRENAELRAKVSFYESRIADMNAFRSSNKEIKE